MSEHKTQLSWKRTNDTFEYKSYSRNHKWMFENGLAIEASAAESFLGDPTKVDPEEAFVASLSSCHMLTFLAVCTKRRLIVNTYEDRATGFLEKSPEEGFIISRVELRPIVVFEGDSPEKNTLRKLHHMAHTTCFLANSVKCEIKTILE
ncbi:MAG: OsmC family protein [Verrucomicrobiota bacterium]